VVQRMRQRDNELRMTNTSAVVFIRHSSFLTPAGCLAAFFIGVTHAPGGAPLRMTNCGSKFQVRGSRLTSRRNLKPGTLAMNRRTFLGTSLGTSTTLFAAAK